MTNKKKIPCPDGEKKQIENSYAVAGVIALVAVAAIAAICIITRNDSS